MAARRRGGLNFRKQRRQFNLPLFKEILSWAIEIVVVCVIAYVLVSFFGYRTSVVGQAMDPTLKNEEQVLINKFSYALMKPSEGDVVAFLPNGNEKSHYYIRRVVAVPGDTVLIQNGALYVNGELYNEHTEVYSMEDAGIASEEIKLGEKEYFVLGDNRNYSEDSRFANIGPIEKGDIIGRVWFRYAGFGDMGRVK